MRAVRDGRYKYIRNFFPESLYTTHIDKLRKVNAGAYWDSWEREAKIRSAGGGPGACAIT
jgi:hypothetical protein